MKRGLIIFVTLLFIIVFLLCAGYLWFKKEYQTYESSIHIVKGTSSKQVADLLEINGAVNNANTFYLYIRGKEFLANNTPLFDTFKVSLKPGEYNLEPGNFDTIIETLNEKPKTKQKEDNPYITIPEGSNIESIGNILESHNIISSEEFLRLNRSSEFYNTFISKYSWLPDFDEDKRYQFEGYLQANTYDLRSSMTPTAIFDMLLIETNKWFEQNKLAIADTKFTFDEILTLASIIEKESKHSSDRYKVSAVFHNRLNTNMKLQSDITALYAIGEHKINTTYEDTKTESPYNTYAIEGLPIGPINSPSLESFNAALQPEKDFPHIYFYARPEGETIYTSTYEEHLQVKEMYEHEWKALNE